MDKPQFGHFHSIRFRIQEKWGAHKKTLPKSNNQTAKPKAKARQVNQLILGINIKINKKKVLN